MTRKPPSGFETFERALSSPTRSRHYARIDVAVAACLLAAARGASAADAADASEAESTSKGLQEITVTANRRVENAQDVPISIQALTGEALQQLSIANFDDAVKYLPNVTLAGGGPGQSNIYMRGLSVGPGTIQGSGAVGDFPNVAVYLDDQSAQLPNRNLDIYAADLERIEVLEGPQGTLFGAGAEAGVVRYITNKPKLNRTEGNVNAGYAYTAHGSHSSNADAMINLPLISDTLAFRAAIYSDTRGGYIDNVPGTFVRQSSDLGIHYAAYANNMPGPATPLNSVNNNNLVGKDINPVTYQGIRASALWQISEDWDALLVQSYQDMDAQGVFYETPQASGTGQNLPDLSVQLYNPSYDKDRFENTAITINGKIGVMKLVYSGAYLVRNVDQVQDYTAYARGTYADYYQCIPPSGTTAAQCYSPSTTWRDHERDIHQSHELRLATPEDWRLRGVGGVFWENYLIHEQTDWQYKTAPGFTNVAPPAGAYANDPSIRNDNVSFFDDVLRGYKQRAVFASLDFDIIPKVLTITAGTRFYRFDDTEVGSAAGSFGCYEAGPPPCTTNGALNLNAEGLRTTYTGVRSRGNLTWKVTPDAMVYYTWSQGFRPGGFNRSSHFSESLNYASPLAFAPDTLTNNEFGWKTEWLDHRVQFNSAIYQEDWKNVQDSFFDPQYALGNLAFETNGPNYRVRGVETQIVARILSGLTVTGAASWNSSDQTNSPYLKDVTGQPITSIPNPYGTPGSTLAESPPFQGNLRVRYERDWGDYHPFVQVGGQHQAHSHSATGYVQNYDQAAYSTYDAFAGVSKDDWTAQLYCENLTDTRADMFTSNSQQVKAITVNRPRTAGLRFSYKFGGR
jgi:iron complex outermembrane recepter protein